MKMFEYLQPAHELYLVTAHELYLSPHFKPAHELYFKPAHEFTSYLPFLSFLDTPAKKKVVFKSRGLRFKTGGQNLPFSLTS
jgi:hypothetical protein